MSEFSMYQLSNEIKELKQLAYSDEIDNQTFLDTFETMQMAVEDKVEAAGYIVSMLEADAEKCKQEKLHLGDVQKEFEKRAEGMKEKMKNLMKVAELDEVKGGRFTAKICNAGGVKKLSKYNEQDVPEKYMKLVLVPDESKMREDLDNGIELGFVHYEPKTTYLKLK